MTRLLVEDDPNFEVIDSIVEADYSWSAIGVWRNVKTNQFFWSTDSGCACNGPWESLEASDLFPLTEGNFAEFAAEAEDFINHGITAADIASFLHEIQQKMDIWPGVMTVGRD